MTNRDDRLLSKVAQAVADEMPVDWQAEEGTDETLKGRLQQLQKIEGIRNIHRTPDFASDRGRTVSPNPLRDQAAGASTVSNDPSTTTPAGRWGQLVLLNKIGEGGYGEVFLARDTRLQTDVALKLFHPELGRRPNCAEFFLSEARRLAKVRHPNVLVVHGADRHEGRVGLWTELIHGRTLEDCLRAQGQFGAREAMLIGTDVLRALAAVHRAGLLHRDIKTENVMREDGGRIVLMDFSTAVDRGSLSDLSSPEAFAGTAVYMAPELFKGESGGVAADIYSVGVLLYRLVTGKYPVRAEGLDELRHKHEHGGSVPLTDERPDLPDAFVRVVERALSTDPAMRYQSAGEMERVLSSSRAPTTEKPVPVVWWKRPITWAAASVAVAVTGLLLWGVLKPQPLEVYAGLFRNTETVSEQLTTGSRVAPGDELFLEMEGSEDMCVYVFTEDENGNAYVLFPLQGVDQKNPLESGLTHELPGLVNGARFCWNVDSAGGTERFYVIASRDPIAKLESQIEQLPQAGSEVALEISPSILEPILRGIGGLSEVDATADSTREISLADLFDRYKRKQDRDTNLFTWKIELENPEER